MQLSVHKAAQFHDIFSDKNPYIHYVMLFHILRVLRWVIGIRIMDYFARYAYIKKCSTKREDVLFPRKNKFINKSLLTDGLAVQTRIRFRPD